jgi:hypothetical protein
LPQAMQLLLLLGIQHRFQSHRGPVAKGAQAPDPIVTDPRDLFPGVRPEQQAEWQRIEADLVTLVESIIERLQDRLDNALGA